MYTTEKQAPGRLTRRRSGRRWLLIPALCAVLILAVVLIVELGKKPQVLPAETPATPISQEKPQKPEPTPEPIPELLTLEPGAGGLVCGPGDPAQRAGGRQALL